MSRRRFHWRSTISALLAATLLCALALPALLLYTRPMDDRSYALIDFEAALEKGGMEDWDFYLNQAGTVTPLVPSGYGGYDGLAYDGQTFYYSRVLDQALESPTLRIDVAHRSIAVFLDGTLLYTDFPEQDNRIGYLQLPMQAWDRTEPVLLTLPTGYQGAKLTIAQSTDPGGGELQGLSTVFPCGVTLYCGFAYESGLIASATGTAMWMVFLFCLATALLLLLVYQASQQCANWGVLFLAALLLVRMVGVMAASDFSVQYLPWETTPDLIPLSFQLSATASTCFLAVHMDRRPKFALWAGAVVQTGLALAWCWLQRQGAAATDWAVTAWVPTTASALLLAAALVLSGLHGRKKRSFFVRYGRVSLYLAAMFAGALTVRLLLRPEYRHAFFKTLQFVALDNAILPLRLLNLWTMVACVVTVALEFLRSQADRGAQQAMLALRAQMAQESYQSIRQQVEEVAIVRHDLRKHLAVAFTLLSDGRVDQAADYLNQVSQGLESVRPVVDTGNYLVDILLNSTLGRLRDQGVRLEVHGASASPSMAVSDADLSALLLNAMDNASHAVLAPGVEDPWVALTLHTGGGYFYFACENAISPDDRPEGQARADQGHGYGHIIMERIVEKYDGIMEASRLADRYRLVLALHLEGADMAAPTGARGEMSH